MKKPLLFLLAVMPATAAFAQNTGIGTAIPTDQLHTTGTVRFEGYRGPGTRLMQIDSSGRMLITGAGPVFSATPVAAIPDNGCGAGNAASSSIIVSGQSVSAPSAKIAVRINITHTFVGDLRILLVAPSGAILNLAFANGGGNANFINTVFSDAATTLLSAGSAPFTGKFKSAGNTGVQCLITPTVATFSALGGGTINANGTWTLKVFDATAQDVGTLNSWDLSFSGPESFTTADQANYIPKFAAGNLDPSNIYQDPVSKNVSIGTNAALYPLSVYGTGAGIVQYDPGNGVNVGTYTNSYGGGLQTYNNNALTFATNAAALPQMTLNTAGNMGIGVAPASIGERLHVDGGNLKIGLATWSSAGNDRFLKFGDGSFVTIGETGADDRMQLTATNFIFRKFSGATAVGINTTSAPAYTLDVTGDLRTTAAATIQGAAQVGGVLSTSSNLQVTGTARIGGGGPAAGKVLTATNTSGDAAWAVPAATNSAFYATIAPGNTALFPDAQVTTIPFTTTAATGFNDGGTWNNTSNAFVAAAAGVYHFDLIMNFYFGYWSSVSSYKIEMYKNGALYISKTYDRAGESPVINWTLKLNASDQISFKFNNNVYADCYSEVSSGKLCGVAGYRIY